MRRALVWLVLLWTMLGLGACGATRHPVVGSPGDFALGVTVLGTKDGGRLPRGQRPARYVVEPDGVLRVAVGAGVEASTFPSRVRRLSRLQVERLWELVEAGGYLREDHPGQVRDVEGFRPTPRDGWALVDVTAGGQRRAVAVRVDEDQGAARLADELAGLAWIRE